MNEIYLPSFMLEKMSLTNQKHLELIKKLDNDDLVKKYLFPYKSSFYDLVTENIESFTFFHNFYVIYLKEKIIGYVEIETPKKTYLNYAILKEERNKGYALLFLREIADYILNTYQQEVESVNTIIRKTNQASIQASLKSGFVLLEDNDPNFETFTKKDKNSI